MWIVKLALNRPYTFLVAALLILILSPVVILGTPGTPGMPVDIFPNIGIPVVSVVWSYTGLPADEMSRPPVATTMATRRAVVCHHLRTARLRLIFLLSLCRVVSLVFGILLSQPRAMVVTTPPVVLRRSEL